MFTGTRIFLCFFLVFSFANIIVAQEADFPKDTSYNILSNYRKQLKYYPFVKPINEQKVKGVAEMRELIYKDLGARKLHLDVFYPKKKKKGPFPGVIMIHGGGWASGTKAHQIPMAQRLAEKGYVAVAIEYRLSPEAQYPAGVEDLKEAVKWMRTNAKILGLDTNKIASLGCSSGAQLASLLGVTSKKDRLDGPSAFPGVSSDIQAVVNIDGIVSFIHEEADKEGKYAGIWLGGDRITAAKEWKAASALEYVGKDNPPPPFLFLNSSHPRFHAGRDDMIKVANTNGVYTQTITFPDSPHSFWLVHPWFEPSVTFTLQFLDKVFKEK